MLFDIFFTLFLVFLNGFFVAAEFSIVKVRFSQIHLKAEKGDRFAKVSENIINHLDTYLSATQLGITIASLGLGWIGEPVVSKIIASTLNTLNITITKELLHSISMPLGFLIITVLHIVFGELAPKSIAIRKAESTTLAISYPLYWFFIIFRPFIWFMNSLSNLFLHIIGIEPLKEHEIHSVEELRLLVKQSKDAGAIHEENYEIIKNAFDFTDYVAKQIMIPRQQIFAVSVKLSKEQIIKEIIENGYSRVPVYEASVDNILGVIYAKDIFKAQSINPHFDINSIIHPAFFVIETKRISEILADFKRKHLHLAVIVDEFGGTQGIITLEDILEELVGEIQDEDDDEKQIVEISEDNIFTVQAAKSLIDINEYLPHPLPRRDEYTTLSGLILYYLGRIPVQNEKIIIENYEISIVKIQHRLIQVVQLKEIVDNNKIE